MKYLQVFIILLLGIILFGAITSQAQAKVQPYLPEPDLFYPNKLGEPELVGDQLVSNGVPSKIYHFKTNDAVDKVADFYLERWKTKGYPVHKQFFGEMTNVSAIVNPQKGIIKSVLVYLDPKEQKTFVFSTTSIIDFSGNYDEMPTDLPQHPDSEVFSTFSSKDTGGGMSLIIHENKAPVAFMKNYYFSAMKQKGWQISQEMNAAFDATDGNTAVFRKGARACFLSITENDNKKGSFIVFNIMKTK